MSRNWPPSMLPALTFSISTTDETVTLPQCPEVARTDEVVMTQELHDQKGEFHFKLPKFPFSCGVRVGAWVGPLTAG